MSLTDVERTMRTVYGEANPRTWPSPRGPLESPRDREYERVTDPERYAITHLRGAAWAVALAALPEVTSSAGGDTTTLTSSRQGAAPLLLRSRRVATNGGFGDLPMLEVRLGDPAITLAVHPDCGCDACDSGSDDLLEAIDDVIAAAIGGTVVIITGDGWEARWTNARMGVSSSGDVPKWRHESLMEACERIARGEQPPIPRDARVFSSRGWFD